MGEKVEQMKNKATTMSYEKLCKIETVNWNILVTL